MSAPWTSVQVDAGVPVTLAGVEVGSIVVTVRVPGINEVGALVALALALGAATDAVRTHAMTLARSERTVRP